MLLDMGGSSGGAWLQVAAALAVVAATTWLWAALVRLVWRPYAVARAFARQGVRGPPYRLYYGNSQEANAMRAATSGATLDRSSHDFIPRVMPHFRAWMPTYGKVFLWWLGTKPTLCVGSYDAAKRILSNRTGLFAKPEPPPSILALLGMGLVFTNGEVWARHRRVVHPAFTMDKLRMMTGAMAACAGEVVRAWESRAAEDGEVTVEVGHQFTELTADVISHTVFGSGYREGKEVFLAQRELQLMAFTSLNSKGVVLPGTWYVPTKANLRRWKLEKKVRDTLVAIIDGRLKQAGGGGCYGSDLLGLMLEANAGEAGSKRAMSMDEIIDECKTFFFAGHDTTSHLLTWAMFLLCTHPEWQQRLREEVLLECGEDAPITGDALNKLKLMTMVLYETLRLYSSVTVIPRLTKADADLCGVKVPKGTVLFIPIVILHRDQEVWGPDAGEFNPLRFRDGVGRAAAQPGALLAFSAGPRSCIGQDLAMLEAKATLALILRRFAFEVAPDYVHAPAEILTLQPSRGLPIVLKLLDSHP